MPADSNSSNNNNGILGSLGRFLQPSNGTTSTSQGALIIRNLTSERLTIDQVQRSAHLNAVKVLKDEDPQLVLAPFTTSPTTLNNYEQQPDETALLTFQDGQSNKTELLLSGNKTLTEVVQTQRGQPRLTSIYDPSSRFLTLYELPDLRCWMKAFRDDTSIAALSIPGTHNSPTYHWALPSVRCQAVSPLQQLEHGVRFFDLRVQPAKPQDPNDETLNLVHGAFPISLTGTKKFRHLLDDIDKFLAANPSETLIVSLKREGTGQATDAQLADIIATHYAKTWYTEARIPTIGEARGKVVLMRRFGLSDRLRSEHPNGWGLDAESWADNTASCVHGQVCVQDFYEVLNTKLIPKKLEVSCAQFERAAAVICPLPEAEAQQATSTAMPIPTPTPTSPPQQVYLNFLTASNFFNFRCWPENIAAKLNPAVTSFICEKHDCGDEGINGPGQPFSGDGGLGIVVCDWVGKSGNWDLVKCIVGMNSRRLYRERGYGWR